MERKTSGGSYLYSRKQRNCRHFTEAVKGRIDDFNSNFNEAGLRQELVFKRHKANFIHALAPVVCTCSQLFNVLQGKIDKHVEIGIS